MGVWPRHASGVPTRPLAAANDTRRTRRAAFQDAAPEAPTSGTRERLVRFTLWSGAVIGLETTLRMCFVMSVREVGGSHVTRNSTRCRNRSRFGLISFGK